MNVWDIVIAVLILAAVAAAIRVMWIRRNSGCSCGCESCRKDCRSRKSDPAAGQESCRKNCSSRKADPPAEPED